MKLTIVFAALALASGVAAQAVDREDAMRNLARSLLAEYEDILEERSKCKLGTKAGKTCVHTCANRCLPHHKTGACGFHQINNNGCDKGSQTHLLKPFSPHIIKIMKFTIVFAALALASGVAAQAIDRQDAMRNLARSLIAEYEDFLAEREEYADELVQRGCKTGNKPGKTCTSSCSNRCTTNKAGKCGFHQINNNGCDKECTCT
ncbi:hypothetical protein BKA70DRAFT_1436321 [Coprinopsis sp. MPI-PUGE-AT-0042]|nr:hypothetical protein BKA70DRAFT_1436321 [Coprinopsis sp. MPI-PUGE-AT-0042]